MKTKEEIEKMIKTLVDQYQLAGTALFEAKTAEGSLWAMELCDRLTSAIDVLSWAMGESEDIDTKLASDPAKPFSCCDSECGCKEGYTNILKELKVMLNQRSDL